MSLLRGEFENFICKLFDNEADWKKWYMNPLTEEMPKIEVEMEKSSKLL